MFEKLMARVELRAREKSAMRVVAITARIARDGPPDIGVTSAPSGVTISGRGLIRRHVTDPAVRQALKGSAR